MFRFLRRSPIVLYRDLVKHPMQKLIRGYSDADLWELDVHLAEIILPRLKSFRDMDKIGHPAGLTEEEWQNILDKMIYSFEALQNQYHVPLVESKAEAGKIEEGLNLFATHLCDLWD